MAQGGPGAGGAESAGRAAPAAAAVDEDLHIQGYRLSGLDN